MKWLVAFCLVLSACSGFGPGPSPVVSPSSGGSSPLPVPTDSATVPSPSPVVPVASSVPSSSPVAPPVISPTPSPSLSPSPVPVPTASPLPSISPVAANPGSDPSCAGISVFIWPKDSSGWTLLPALTQPGRRVIYVSAKNTVHNDGTSYWVQTSEQGMALLRKDLPDSLLYNRGETFHLAAGLVTPNLSGGATPDLAKVVGAYGSGARPILMWNQRHSIIGIEGSGLQNLIVTQLDIEPDPSLPIQGTGITMFPNGTASKNLLIEDVKVTGFGSNMNIENIAGVTIRRNEILKACGLFRSQGIYLAANKGILIEENFMDSNGLMNCSDPNSGSGQAQNIYEQSDNKCLTVKSNLISNAHGNGLEARTGGVITGNVFYNNNTHMNFCETLGGSIEGKVMPRYCGGEISGNAFMEGGMGMTTGAISSPTAIANNVNAQHGTTHSAFLVIDSQNGVGVHGLIVSKNSVYQAKYFASYQWGLPAGKVKMFNDGSQTQWQCCDGVFKDKDGFTDGMAGLPPGQMIWKYVSTPAPSPVPSPKNVGCYNGLSVNGADVWTDETPSVKVIDSIKTGIFMTPQEAPIHYDSPNSFVSNWASVTTSPFEVSQTAWKTNPAIATMPENGDNLTATFVNPAFALPSTLPAAMAAQSREAWNAAITPAVLIPQIQAAYKSK